MSAPGARADMVCAKMGTTQCASMRSCSIDPGACIFNLPPLPVALLLAPSAGPTITADVRDAPAGACLAPASHGGDRPNNAEKSAKFWSSCLCYNCSPLKAMEPRGAALTQRQAARRPQRGALCKIYMMPWCRSSSPRHEGP